MKNTLILSIAASAALSISSMAADVPAEAPKPATVESSKNWTFDGAIRMRLEQFNGWNVKAYGDDSHPAKAVTSNGTVGGGADATKTVGESDDTVLMQQVIAGVTYKPTKDITAKFNIKDSRTYGWSLSQEKAGNENLWDDGATGYNMNPNEEYFEVNDAYLEVKNLFTKGLTATVGRQSISYGDKKIFGPGEFGNTGQWRWDAIKLGYKWDNNFVDVFYGGTKIHDPESSSFPNEHAFNGIGVYSHFETTKTGAIEPFYARKMSTSDKYTGMSSVKGDLDQRWIGARVYDDNVFGFFYDATYAKESGRFVNTDVDAKGYTIHGGYHAKALPMKPKFELGYTYASGEESGPNSSGLSDGVSQKFEPAFGANDYPYGWMNIVAWNNIKDKEIKITFTPMDKVKVIAEHHWYNLASEFQGMTAAGGYKNVVGNHFDEVGQETNIEARYQYNKDIDFRVWLAYFKAGEFITGNNIAQNDATWMAFQATYKFQL